MKKELLAAIGENQVEVVDEILSKHPELLKELVIGKSWLNYAAEDNNIDVMQLFLDKGIPVDGLDGCKAPISSAADRCSLEAVEWLLGKGANVEGSGKGSSPLIGAIHANSLELVRLLLKHGARTDYTWGHFNYSPRTFAESFGSSHAEIARLLGSAKETIAVPDISGDIDPIVQHLEKYYGKLEPLSLHEIVSDLPITIHVIKLQEPQACTLLVTSGMSEYEMSVPQGAEQFKYAELIMCLPPDWPTNYEAIQKAEFSWPFEWIRRIAHYPMQFNTWLGETGSFSNEEPPQPFADNTEFSGILALTEKSQIGQLEVSEDKMVQFYSLYPLYKEEMNLLNNKGVEKLLRQFEKHNIPTIVDLNRKNVGKSWFGR